MGITQRKREMLDNVLPSDMTSAALVMIPVDDGMITMIESADSVT